MPTDGLLAWSRRWSTQVAVGGVDAVGPLRGCAACHPPRLTRVGAHAEDTKPKHGPRTNARRQRHPKPGANLFSCSPLRPCAIWLDHPTGGTAKQACEGLHASAWPWAPQGIRDERNCRDAAKRGGSNLAWPCLPHDTSCRIFRHEDCLTTASRQTAHFAQAVELCSRPASRGKGEKASRTRLVDRASRHILPGVLGHHPQLDQGRKNRSPTDRRRSVSDPSRRPEELHAHQRNAYRCARSRPTTLLLGSHRVR